MPELRINEEYKLVDDGYGLHGRQSFGMDTIDPEFNAL
jgi:hypothetical protein